ncbi:MAG: DHA2 family efflux MFS transporter permease subunit [Holophaga sp.]|nr:DHA2 family efflux MFS transporter permease subunit [Holophaga sp.]
MRFKTGPGTGDNLTPAPDPKPTANLWMIAASVMIATFMVVLDSSVANVALPHIAGNLSAATDESTWVLTSYLVSNAIMLPATGWISRRIGRKRLLMGSIVMFTGASMLCGLATSMPMLIAARILQGVGGGGMLPLSQAILLESFPPRQHGTAMAVYGLGIVVAPVAGPTLGGWITDSFSWRWIFLINLPVGVLALAMARRYIIDPPYLKQAQGSIDIIGFALMAVWVGALQLVLDKGQEADWFGSAWICWLAALAVVALIAFIYREFNHREPIVQLRVLGDRNFGVGTLINTIYGSVLYGFTAMLPLFLQTLMGYPALDSGLAVSPRGLGSIMATLVMGTLSNYVDGRVLLAFGFSLLGISALVLSHINLEISMVSVILPNLMNGFATGCIFVPLTTLTMGRLAKQEIGNAAGIYNLMRNLGGSVGIAAIMSFLVRGTQVHQNYLVANVTAGNAAVTQRMAGLEAKLFFAGMSPHTAHQKAVGMLYGLVQHQASLAAYVDNFRLLGCLALLCVPLAFLFVKVRKQVAGGHEVISE